jgi:hypothetical protein
MIDHRLHLWRLYDAVTGHLGGCAICGDDDEFSPDIEAFEETEMLICSACFEAQCEALEND